MNVRPLDVEKINDEQRSVGTFRYRFDLRLVSLTADLDCVRQSPRLCLSVSH